MPKWWRFGQEAAERPLAPWMERVRADVAASAPRPAVKDGDAPAVPVTGLSPEVSIPLELTREAVEAFGGAFAASALPRPEVRQERPEPGRTESVREYLLRTPHEFERDRSALARGSVAYPCACGQPVEANAHWGEALLNTRRYLAGIAAALASDEPEEDSPEMPPRPAACRSSVAAVEEDAPETTPLPEIPKPEPLPDGVLGYNVATTRTLSGGGWLASADIMTREIAERTISVTGGRLVEIREVPR